MANSGRVLTNTLKNSQYYVDWQIASQSTNGNYSDINWQAGIIANQNQWYYNAMKINSIVINGNTVLSGGVYSNVNGGTHQLASGSIRIYHNDDGNKNIDVGISAWLYDYGNCSGANSWALTQIPRYANITSFEVLKRNETSVKIRYSVDANCDWAQYSKNDGSTWLDLPNDGIIEGLSPNTLYNFKIKLRRTSNQLWTTSGRIQQTTYDYPKPSSLNHFVIGEGATVFLENPLGRNCTLDLISKETNGVIGTYVGSGHGNVNAEFKTEEAIDKQYASIPNSQSGGYYAKVTYEGNVRTLDWNGKYSVKGDEIPTFTNFTYKDTNSKVTNITGNNQVLVKGFSTLQVTISSSNKMVANKHASGKNYIATIEGLNANANYSTSNVTLDLGTVLDSGTKRLNVTAYDTRNLSTTAYKDIIVYDYTKPVINVDVARLNNFDAQTVLKINGTYDKLTINESNKNSITSVEYRYREVAGEWSEWTTVNTTITSGKFTCNDIVLSLDSTKSFELEVKASDKLDNNVASGTVDVGEAIFFISTNKKQCYINGKQVFTGLSQDVNRTDLNDYMNDFVAGYGHNLTNAPTSNLNLGHLLSIPRYEKEGFTTQLFSPYTTNDLYIRKCDEGVWGDWVNLNPISGSNNNGYYIKYPDGTMICRTYIDTTTTNNTYHYATATWTYPQEFIATPNVVVTMNDWSTHAPMTKINPTKTVCSIMALMLNTSTVKFIDGIVVSLSVIAIGRWK